MLREFLAGIFVRLIYALVALVAAQTLSCILFRLFGCKKIGDNWLPADSSRKCVSREARSAVLVAHSAVGVAVDFALLALPIWVVWSKMMFSAKMLRVVTILFVGMFAVITGIVRLVVLLRTNFSLDP
jgi:hypothetical protein